MYPSFRALSFAVILIGLLVGVTAARAGSPDATAAELRAAEMVRSALRLEAEGDAKLNPADIAEAYWSIDRQPRSAWTMEADLRTWVEKF